MIQCHSMCSRDPIRKQASLIVLFCVDSSSILVSKYIQLGIRGKMSIEGVIVLVDFHMGDVNNVL